MELNNFPRNITSAEKLILFSVLPESKSGYKIYRDKLENMLVIGAGRFGGNNYILGNADSKPDLSLSSSPVFAIGTLYSQNIAVDVVIHEEQDDQIEYDITSNTIFSLEDEIRIDMVRSYSEWKPSENVIFKNSEVRQYVISTGNFILAIAPDLKKIWLHKILTGVNHIIPLTNFFNELMRLKNIRDPKRALSPQNFFENLNEFTDAEIKNAFILYNRYLKKFQIPDENYSVDSSGKYRKKLFKLFSRG